MSRQDPHSYADGDQAIVQHLDWRLELDFASKRLRGEARLAFAAPAASALDLDTRALDIETVLGPDGAPIPWSLDAPDQILGQRLRLQPPPGATAVTIRYATTAAGTALGWLDPPQTAGGRQPFVFSQCQAIHARALVPCQDTPRFRLTYSAAVAVPGPLRAVMAAAPAGKEAAQERGAMVWRYHMPQPIPPYLLAMAAGELDAAELGPRTRVYAEPPTLAAAAWEFAEVDGMLRAAERLFGPYPWDRFDLLVMPPAFPYGGMENPRLTFLTPTLLAGDRSLVNVVAHELAHSWTGNLVTNATMDDFWLNEGFTVYAERRILEALHGPERAALHAAIGRQQLQAHLDAFGPDSPLTKLRTDLAGVDPDEIYSLVPYEKGFMLLVLLERTVGRPRFDEFLRAYLDRFRFQSITTEQFEDFCAEQLPGAMEQAGARLWIHAPNVPPNEPVFPCTRLTALRSLAAAWSEGERPALAEAAAWTSEEWLIFLQALPRKLPAEECAWLDRSFGLTARGNHEVLVAWLTIAAASGYPPALPRVREVLTRVGRAKYLRPLYAALAGDPALLPLAREIYTEARDGYHHLARLTVEAVLNRAAGGGA